MNNTKEALEIWSALKPMIVKTIDERTKSCIRSKKMRVITAPNGSTIGVREPFDTVTYNIPYSSSLTGAVVGDTVWVQWYYDNASTMIAMSFGDGDTGFYPECGWNMGNDLNNATTPGVYSYSYTYSHVPASTAGGSLLVVQSNATTLSQFAFSNNSSKQPFIYARHYYTDGWGSWYKITGNGANYPYQRNVILNTTYSNTTSNAWENTGLTVDLVYGHIYTLWTGFGHGRMLGFQFRESGKTYSDYEYIAETGGNLNVCPMFFCGSTKTYYLWVKRNATGQESYWVADLGVTT